MNRITYHTTEPFKSADVLFKWLSGFTSVPVAKMVAIYYQSDGSLNVARTEMSPDELQESLDALKKEIKMDSKTG